jgi:hypothetical protein
MKTHASFKHIILILSLVCISKKLLSEQYEIDAGLILSGLDTFSLPKRFGFDFVKAEICTTTTDQISHIAFDNSSNIPGNGGYEIRFAASPFFAHYKAGNINLDSIKDAALLPEDGIERVIDSIPPDSLAQYIGNVYVIKTDVDPRRDVPIHAKIKILDFFVRDAENHEIDMIFLWTANLSGKLDLNSAGLDTFTLDYTVDTINGSAVSSPGIVGNAITKPGNNIKGFKTMSVNGMVSIPSGMATRNGILMLFDPKGRVLGQVRSEDISKSRNIRITGGYNGVVVVK